MRKSIIANVVLGTVALAALAVVPMTSAIIAHEKHQMECTETSLNAMNADIQSMKEGEAKTTAMKEMQMAQEMMASKDMKGCEAHMHGAMEAMEK